MGSIGINISHIGVKDERLGEGGLLGGGFSMMNSSPMLEVVAGGTAGGAGGS